MSLAALAATACSGESDAESDVEIVEEFTRAFIDGDVDELANRSTSLASLGAIPWRAEFLRALNLAADSFECIEGATAIDCTIVGHNDRLRLLAPDLEARRTLSLVVENGVVTSGSFEFTAPEFEPIFDDFNRWAMANRRDVIEGPCADIDGTSDPSECALAVLEATTQYVEESEG